MASRMSQDTSLDSSTGNCSEIVSSPVDSYKNSNGYSIVLENKRVVILREQKEVGSSVLLEDILGVHQVTHNQSDGVKLVVHGFPKTKKIFRSEARSLMKLVMHFDSENASEEWKRKIILQSRKVIQEKYGWYQGEVYFPRELQKFKQFHKTQIFAVFAPRTFVLHP